MMENKLKALLHSNKKLLSIYFTAGYPEIYSTTTILNILEKCGVDFVEIGMPFTDPVADGSVIQNSSMVALNNGMKVKTLFEQLSSTQHSGHLPKILMGYLNPVLQYGIIPFLEKCHEVGVEGVILPDLPFDIYLKDYKMLFEKYNIIYIPLIAPNTPNERIKYIDENIDGAIYMVSTHGTTGLNATLQHQEEYFKRVSSLKLQNPLMIGFGIRDRKDIEYVLQYGNAAIVGSAFVSLLKTKDDLSLIPSFINSLKS